MIYGVEDQRPILTRNPQSTSIASAQAITLHRNQQMRRTIASPQSIGLVAGKVFAKNITLASPHSMNFTAAPVATPLALFPRLPASGRILQPGNLQGGVNLRVNWKHPIASGLVHLELFDQARRTDHPYLPQSIGTHGTLTATSATARPGPGGYGLSMSAVGGGMAATTGNLLRMPQTAGSLFAYVTAEFNAGDSLAHYVLQVGKESGGTEQIFQLFKNTDNNTYFRWFTSGASSGAVVASSGLWSAGETFMYGGTWDTADMRLFVKGKLAGSKGSAPTTNNTTTTVAAYRVGGIISGTTAWGSTAGKNFIYYTAIWNRALSADECNYLNQNPYCFLTAGARG